LTCMRPEYVPQLSCFFVCLSIPIKIVVGPFASLKEFEKLR
jgi:hypothetical protein